MEYPPLFDVDPIEVFGQAYAQIGIADDQPDKRKTLRMRVESAGLTPIVLDELYPSREAIVEAALGADAIISDHQFGHKKYAPCTGSEFLADLYGHGKAVVLTTAFDNLIHEIRPFRRWIPVLLSPEERDPDRLREAIRYSAEEVLSGEFAPERRPLRTLVRIEYIDDGEAHVVIPEWDPGHAVAFPLSVFDGWPQRPQEEDRFFALSNVSAPRPEDLYLDEIQPPAPRATINIPYDLGHDDA
ncbi:MAG: hypothetical protein SangKO_099850 [Sandaracinaceae bacterium]